MTISDDLTRPIVGLENRTPLEVFDIMADRIRRALSQAGAGGGVVVRPLEWKPMQPGWTTSVADSVFGRYVAGHGYWKRPDCETAVLGVTNLDEGKAAAQADYSARIIAALAPSPSAGERGRGYISADNGQGMGLPDRCVRCKGEIVYMPEVRGGDNVCSSCGCSYGSDGDE